MTTAPAIEPAQHVRMTTEQMLALPEDANVVREVIDGELRERPMTKRNYPHSRSQMQFGYELLAWVKTLPREQRGVVVGGEAAIRISKDPDTSVGVDVAYIGPELARQTEPDARLIDGVPILIVEILSFSDTQEDILDKVSDYLHAGVKLVWVAEPVFQVVTVYRPDAKPRSFNADEILDGEPHLPGFGAKVSALFGD